MDVPLIDPYPPPGRLERMLTPGAETSGLRRPEPSSVTGPRLENEAMPSEESVAPTLKEAS